MADHDVVLLDTSVAIAPPAERAEITDRVAVSEITIAELASGLNVTSDPVERALRQERFTRVLTAYDVVPYTTTAARLYGALCDVVRESGRSPRARRFDLLIASAAGDLGVPVLTRNVDAFRGIHPVVRVLALP